MVTEQKKSPRVIVVNELPQQPVVEAKTEEGEEVKFITLTDAVSEIYSDIKEIKKGL